MSQQYIFHIFSDKLCSIYNAVLTLGYCPMSVITDINDSHKIS
jgi:hypothetical protein